MLSSQSTTFARKNFARPCPQWEGIAFPHRRIVVLVVVNGDSALSSTHQVDSPDSNRSEGTKGLAESDVRDAVHPPVCRVPDGRILHHRNLHEPPSTISSRRNPACYFCCLRTRGAEKSSNWQGDSIRPSWCGLGRRCHSCSLETRLRSSDMTRLASRHSLSQPKLRLVIHLPRFATSGQRRILKCPASQSLPGSIFRISTPHSTRSHVRRTRD